ncbi:somatostatin receptor type 5-like [Glandiceps talaboti]
MSESNQTNEFDNEGIGVLPYWMFHFFIPTFYTIICVSGLIGNTIVIFVVVRCRAWKWVPDVYIFNLAAADCLFLLGLPFLAYFNSTKKWMFGDILCKIITGIDGLNMFTGIFTLTAMSVDRYVAVVHPIWSKTHRTVEMARIVCIVLWILSGLASVPLWIYAKTQTFAGVTVCNVVCPGYIKKTFVIYAFALGFVLPLLIVTISYVNIVLFLYNGTRRPQSRHRIGRVGVMILLAICLFVICWSPFWITQVMITLTNSDDRTKALKVAYFFTTSLTYVNSCLNPVVYTYVRRDFRETITKLLRKGFKSTPRIVINEHTWNGNGSNSQYPMTPRTNTGSCSTRTTGRTSPTIGKCSPTESPSRSEVDSDQTFNKRQCHVYYETTT